MFDEKYDFSEEKASDYYKELSGIEKFMAYYADSVVGFELASPAAQDRADEILGKCGKIIDPDSYSETIQGVYRKMWRDEILEKCEKRDGKITGETLNSVWTTLNELFGYYQNRMSKIKILSQYYADNGKEKFDFLKNKKEFIDFVNVYHTLGNFMPVPVGCNRPRGLSSVQDYWDLTLLNIWKYYSEKEKKYIEYIVNADYSEKYKEWLDAFGTWNEFIKGNYLEAFVDDNGKPK